MNTLKQILIDIRDYAYLWSEKQEEGYGRLYLTNKLFSIYLFYFIMLALPILTVIRKRYNIEPYIELQESSSFLTLIYGFFFMFLPFILARYLLGKFINTPLPIEGVDEIIFKRKKRVFWIAYSIPFIVIPIYYFFMIHYGYLKVSPTNFNIFK